MIDVCHPDELPTLLPDAMAGRRTLLPTPDLSTVTHLLAGGDAAADTAVVVTTSGSTGHPKGVELSASALLASARATRERLGGTPRRWYCPLPLHYVAGLMTLVRAHEAGTQAVTLDPHLTDLPPAGLHEPRAISLVPTQLHRALAEPDTLARLAGFDAVLLGGAPASPEVLGRARAAGVRVVTTYGMSETCGGCVYDGLPLPGVEIRLGEQARVLISGPTLFTRYRNDPALTDETLVDGWLHTRDRGALHEGRLTILGRLDDVVISGGVNVDLSEVQRAVDALLPPGREAAVVGVPDPEWGARVTLALSGDGADDSLASWRERLAGQGLERAALPRQVVTGIRLPRTPSGKIDRRTLAERLSA